MSLTFKYCMESDEEFEEIAHLFVKLVIEIPFGALGRVIGMRGRNINKIRRLFGIEVCDIEEYEGKHYLLLLGLPSVVDSANEFVTEILTKYNKAQSGQPGYTPMFSLFIIDLPCKRESSQDEIECSDATFSLKIVPEHIQAHIDRNDKHRILKSYTVSTTSTFVKSRFLAHRLVAGKQLIAGYERNELGSILGQMYDKLRKQKKRSIKNLDFSANVGNTFLQSKMEFDIDTQFTVDELEEMQQGNSWRQQFCTMTIDRNDTKNVRSWCIVNSIRLDEENSKIQLMVQILHAESGVRFHWTLPAMKGIWDSNTDMKPYPMLMHVVKDAKNEFGTAQVRHGFLSYLSTNPDELTHRLEFAEKIVVPNDHGDSQCNIPAEAWKECQTELLKALKRRDDDGSFSLPLDYPFEIEALNYRIIRRWTVRYKNLANKNKKVIRFARSFEPFQQELYDISVRSLSIDEHGLKLPWPKFIKEAVAVDEYCRCLTEFLVKRRKLQAELDKDYSE